MQKSITVRVATEGLLSSILMVLNSMILVFQLDYRPHLDQH